MSFLSTMKTVYCVFVMICFLVNCCSADETTVCSKFHYEEQLLEKMIRMEINVEEMKSEIKKTQADMIATLGDMTAQMERFADAYKELAGNVSKTQEKNNADVEVFQNKSINDMNVFKRELKKEVDEKKTEVDNYQENAISEVNLIIDNITNKVHQKIKDMELLEVKLGNPTVAFNVHSPKDTSVGTGEIIVFTATILNKGDCYNTTSGKFSASMTGLYYFSAHVCNVAGISVYYGIYVNDKLVAVSSQREDTDSSCGSVSAVSMVMKGQPVWVQMLSNSNRRYYGYNGQSLNEDNYRWNSFTGALLN